jgi:tetratricopeptide (TPR) repeat protein/cold shock CspA family protein
MYLYDIIYLLGGEIMQAEISKAEVLEKEGNWVDALKEYKKLIITYPSSVKIISKIGWCNSRLGYYEDAIKDFTELTLKQPDSAKWHYMVGYQYYCLKEWDNAINWFKKALTLYPDYFVVRYRLGYAMTQTCGKMLKLKNKNFLEAYRQFEECEKIWMKMKEQERKSERANYASVLFQKSKIYIERKDWQNAEKYLRLALSIKDEKDYKYELAKVLYFRKEYEEAMLIASGIRSDHYVEYLKGLIYFETKQYSKALETMHVLAQRRPRDYVYQEITNVHLIMGNIEDAYRSSSQAIRLGVHNHKNYFLMGQVCHRAGLLVNAKENLLKAIQLKKEKYTTDYTEASLLLTDILNQINERGILIDDEVLVAKLRKPINKVKKSGIIHRYISDKGFGFVKCGVEDYFFHITDFRESNKLLIKEGVWVEFIPGESPKGLTAKELSLLKR